MSNLRKLFIVFEEVGPKEKNGDQPFRCYLGGQERDLTEIPQEQWSAAEYWAVHCFSIVADTMSKAGVMKSAKVQKKPTGGDLN